MYDIYNWLIKVLEGLNLRLNYISCGIYGLSKLILKGDTVFSACVKFIDWYTQTLSDFLTLLQQD